MHDIDRAMFEMETHETGEAEGGMLGPHELGHEAHELGHETHELHELGHEAHELGHELGYETHELHELHELGHESHELHELHEFEMTSQLLEVTNEAELEQFIGALLRQAGSAARGFASSGTGRALAGILRSAARSALPRVGQVLGDAVAPGLGGAGSQIGRWLGNRFELEGLSAEDREFETARSFVRFARDAVRQAARNDCSIHPVAVARQAAVTSARRHAPGMVPVIQAMKPVVPQAIRPAAAQAPMPAASRPPSGSPRSGRWVQRGRSIVILDL